MLERETGWGINESVGVRERGVLARERTGLEKGEREKERERKDRKKQKRKKRSKSEGYLPRRGTGSSRRRRGTCSGSQRESGGGSSRESGVDDVEGLVGDSERSGRKEKQIESGQRKYRARPLSEGREGDGGKGRDTTRKELTHLFSDPASPALVFEI